jgi:beta-lactamase class A
VVSLLYEVNKLKIIITIETLVILILAAFLLFFYYNEQHTHCTKYLNDDGSVCLLSPRVYTGMVPAESYLIFNFEPLQKDIQEYITTNGLNVSLYVLNIRDGASFGVNENIPYRALSLNKIPVAMVILKKVEQGKLTLDTLLPIKPQDRDSRAGTLYAQPITELSVKDLLRYMLQESDNTATNVLGEQGTLVELQKIANYINYYEEDTPPYNKIFHVTPKSTANIFLSLYLSTALRPEDSLMILSYLTNTSFDIKKYAQLPDDVIVAQKYGSLFDEQPNYFHSCGIMYVKDSRIFYCTMTEGLYKEEAYNVTGTIVNKIYKFVLEGRKVRDIGINL